MNRPMLVLSLLAALSGTPLRQAEAAADLARSLAEVGAGDVIEVVDGGVGDDAGETVLKASTPTDPPPASALPATEGLAPHPLSATPPPWRVVGRRGDPAHPYPATAGRRRAWLQCFLF